MLEVARTCHGKQSVKDRLTSVGGSIKTYKVVYRKLEHLISLNIQLICAVSVHNKLYYHIRQKRLCIGNTSAAKEAGVKLNVDITVSILVNVYILVTNLAVSRLHISLGNELGHVV